jgi:hypothetical protein
MVVFRWIIGVFAALSAAGALACLVIYISFEVPIWLVRARRLRHWAWLAGLVWFNVEVWGSVLRTIVNWNR